MSILKTLQRDLTCTEIPWIPKNGGTPGRLLNEIVTEEETDINIYGEYSSHFEMYYMAMKEAGASTTSIDNFLTQLKISDVFTALQSSKAHQPAIDFVTNTFKVLESAPPHIAATMFTLGREEIIPDMCRMIVDENKR